MNKREKFQIEFFRKYLFQRYRTAKNMGHQEAEKYMLDAYKLFNEMFVKNKVDLKE